jgi:hypothetical protein
MRKITHFLRDISRSYYDIAGHLVHCHLIQSGLLEAELQKDHFTLPLMKK